MRSRGVALAVAAALLAGCGGDEPRAPAQPPAAAQDGPQHVHGLGVNPADGALYIATHSGLWRTPRGETRPQRVGEIRHDLMGFTVAGPDEFLASGHPAPDDRRLPPHLGLQRSTDGGRSWRAVALLGRADLHVLRAQGRHVYGIDSTSGRLLASRDGGRSWQRRDLPAPAFDLVVAPGAPQRLILATERGLFASRDGGRGWRVLREDATGLLAWPAADSLYFAASDGSVTRSADGGRTFDYMGSSDMALQAFAAAGPSVLLASGHGGEVRESRDGGATWDIRSAAG
ncbi:MAG TPA: hypothetical protein VM266_01290 [Solirubrobacteraceae bacterium]|nr:hypothetical protein [Solirubrobacteraceae bacterium]